LLVITFITGAAVFPWVLLGLSQTALQDLMGILDVQGKNELHRLAFFQALIEVGAA
jgi:hypothetical protein